MTDSQEQQRTTDFHIYVHETDQNLDIRMDTRDPQREAIMRAIAAIMQKAERYPEADECLGYGITG